MLTAAELWNSSDFRAWQNALERYWDFVKPTNVCLERDMEVLNLDAIRKLDAQGWYDFLHDRYFRWKYTAPNRYATTTRQLHRYVKDRKLDKLNAIKRELLSFDSSDIEHGLRSARAIYGLGTAGASGLLALLYPRIFGTADQFVVKALRTIQYLPDAEMLTGMNENSLTIKDGVIIIRIMQKKASELNQAFQTTEWTPRKIDMILWTYGRENDSSAIIKKRAIKDNQCLGSPGGFVSQKQAMELGMTNHEMIAAAVKNHSGENLSTREIWEIVSDAFPHFNRGALLPNDHAEGNRNPCRCAGTENRIFDKIERNKYRVR